MNKREFLERLRNGLSGLPQDDIEERIEFYSEMIDDQTEDGLTEEEAVAGIGSVDEIIAQAVEQTSFTKIAKERIKFNRKPNAWEIVLLALGSPIWLSLIIAAAAVIFSVYVVLWAVIVSLWAVFASLAASVAGCVVECVILIVRGNVGLGVMAIGSGLICAGLAIFMLCGCKAATKGILAFTGKISLWLKNRFIRREESK